LLDWSISPYIAAYFAFRDYLSNAESVAIYAYLEHSGIKEGWVAGKNIASIISPNIRSNQRHFLQQSRYTICTKGEGDKSSYSNHEDVVENQSEHRIGDEESQVLIRKITVPASEEGKALRYLSKLGTRHAPGQNMMWKITFPASEREKALRKLEMFNINAYSLYPSEESLMETVFLREQVSQSFQRGQR